VQDEFNCCGDLIQGLIVTVTAGTQPGVARAV
jgi:hypothetical protein